MLKVTEMNEEQFVEAFTYTSDTLLMNPTTGSIDTAENWALDCERNLIEAKKHSKGWKNVQKEWDSLVAIYNEEENEI